MALRPLTFGLAIVLACSAGQSALAALTGQYLLEGTGADTSGFGRNGTLVGSPTFASGLYEGSNSALQLNGTSQSIELPPNTDFIRNAPGATLLAWVRPDAISGTSTIIAVNNGDTAAGGGTGAGRAVLQIAENQFRALGRQVDSGGSSSTLAFAPAVGTTYFVAGVFDYAGGAIRLYVDGNEVGVTTPSWAANSADTANLIGRIGAGATGTSEFWNGAIDGARIYNTALTATEILNIYAAESSAPVLPGDTDGDGVVEPEDLTPIRNNWRQTGKSRVEGNLTGDVAGLVDFADFRQWKTAILAGGGSLEGIDLNFATVPEPAAVALVSFGAICLGGFVLRGRP